MFRPGPDGAGGKVRLFSGPIPEEVGIAVASNKKPREHLGTMTGIAVRMRTPACTWALFTGLVLGLLLLAASVSGAASRGISITTKDKKEVKLYSGYKALVIGVGQYQKWPKLPGAKKDANEVAGTLRKIGFEVKIINDPTSSQLRDMLRSLPYELGADPKAALLIYYAGHGATEVLADGSTLGYIVPVDCPLSQKNPAGFARRAISMAEVEALALRIKSRHVMMVFDSCFSGSLFAMVRAEPAYISEKVARPTRQFITAGNENEQVPDKSIFKQLFESGIQGEADQDRDGYVTGTELGMYLQNRVVQYSNRAQHPQFGSINNPKLDKGDFVFVVKSKTPTTTGDKAGGGDAGEKPGAYSSEIEAERKRLEAERRQLAEMKKLYEERRKVAKELASLEADRLKQERDRLKKELEDAKRKPEPKPEPKRVREKPPTPPKAEKGFASLDAKVSSLRMYEGGYDIPPKKSRKYRTSFDANGLRYLFWELNLKYPAPGKKVDFKVDAYCYDSGGKLYYHQKMESYAKSTWKSSWVTKGWGNRVPGKAWKPGRYRLEVYADGKRVADQNFTVTSSKASLPTRTDAVAPKRGFAALDATVENLRFFEGGSSAPPNNQRRFVTSFNSSHTKFIYWQLSLKYPKTAAKVDFKIRAVCYKPDGSVLFTQNMSAYAKTGWTSSWHAMGWGNKKAGKAWLPGRYKVVLTVDGKQLAKGYFNVTGHSMVSKASYGVPVKGPFSSLGASVKSLRIFESDYSQPAKNQRQYGSRFKSSSTRFLNWQLDLTYSKPGRRVDFKILAICYRQNGSVLFRQSMDAHANADWTSSWHSMGWGNRALGKAWRPGSYRLDIVVDNQVIASRKFRVER